MTIEDSLEKIELEKDKIDFSKIESQDNPPQTELIKEAHKCLGEYLTDGLFRISVEENLNSFLYNLGPFMLKIIPSGQNKQAQYQRQECSTVNKLDKDLLLACLKSVGKGFLLKTDLGNTNGTELEKGFYKYIPEFNHFQEIYCKSFGTYNLSVHPLVFVMGMKPENRPLITVVIRDAIVSKKIKVPKSVEDYDRKKLLISLAPSLEQVVNVAEKYNVTNIKEILEDFNRVVQSYKDTW
ncbi:hypothetical protein HZA97_09225 [Candidatus Woesearchaeota archaeon]|nr:hypothetical protein [Candidatus Woesearchaeota archaeon]